MNRSCDTCEFWGRWTVATGDPTPLTSGDCRRRPPRRTGWPSSEASDWCGEWREEAPDACPTGAEMDAFRDRHCGNCRRRCGESGLCVVWQRVVETNGLCSHWEPSSGPEPIAQNNA